MTPPHTHENNPPKAIVKPRRQFPWIWLVPIITLILAAGLAHRAWQMRGVIVTVQLSEGHGLEPGDPVRYRGITVGEIREITLDEKLTSVLITLSLQERGKELARRGSRFWVVRPEIAATGVAGLETLLGPRYLAVLPGQGNPQRWFVGLDDPPVIKSIQEGDLEIILRTPSRQGLRAGAPVLYRQMRVGTILSVGLTSDAGAVEVRVHIEHAYAALIRQNTRFWRVQGIEADLNITGLSLGIDSLETLLQGGIALATPPPNRAGNAVHTGHQFPLEKEPDNDWLEWEPLVAIGSQMLPPGLSPPRTLRARLSWTNGSLFGRAKSHQGWVLVTEGGLLGPKDLIIAPESAEEGSSKLEVAGETVSLATPLIWQENDLALRELENPLSDDAWPRYRIEKPDEPVDCLIIADPTASPFPLAVARLHTENGIWRIDETIPIDPMWHGAAIVARKSGKLVGMLLIIDDDDEAVVALLPGKS